MKEHKRTLGLLAVLALSACAGGSDAPALGGDAEHAEAVASSSYELTAGEQSRALGVARWTVKDDVFLGLDRDSKRVAEIRLDQAAKNIESVYPEAGVRGIHGRGQDSFTPGASKMFDALRADLQELVSQSDVVHPDHKTSSVEKGRWVFADCYMQSIDCTAVGQNLLFDPSGVVEHYSCDNIYPANCTRDYPWQLSLELRN